MVYCVYVYMDLLLLFFFFFFNDTATTEIYTLSLHDALPISSCSPASRWTGRRRAGRAPAGDRKSTRLNSSHMSISYAVFCLKKKKKKHTIYFLKKKNKIDNSNIQHCNLV